MEDIFVARIMSTELHTASPETLVEEAAEELLANGIGSLVVTDGDGRIEGILTTTDFVDIVAKSRPKAETTVSRYMSTDVVTVDPQTTIQEAADTIVECGFHHLPVVDGDGVVVGMLTTSDLAAYLSDLRAPTPS